MILVKLFPLLLIPKADSAGCLLKHGFGDLNGGIRVDGESSFPIDFGDCETLCDTRVFNRIAQHLLI